MAAITEELTANSAPIASAADILNVTFPEVPTKKGISVLLRGPKACKGSFRVTVEQRVVFEEPPNQEKHRQEESKA